MTEQEQPGSVSVEEAVAWVLEGASSLEHYVDWASTEFNPHTDTVSATAEAMVHHAAEYWPRNLLPELSVFRDYIRPLIVKARAEASR